MRLALIATFHRIKDFPLKARFKVKDKDKIEVPKFSQKLMVLPYNSQVPFS